LPSEYRFDSPCFLYGAELRAFDDTAPWQSESAWLASLADLTEIPDAFIIPLELPSSGRNRQDLLGYDLLCVLRWSSSEALRGRPVLLAAWQPLQDILRKRPDLLVVRPAVEFTRLPEAVHRLPGFVSDVAAGRIPPATSDEIEAVSAGDQQASQVSYHDLANDYYAAYRIKKGYLALLRTATATGLPLAASELEALSGTRYDWENGVEAKLRSPLVRRFQASRSGLRTPRYPVIEESLEILTYHLQYGLPVGSRLLLVDDEFHKGSAEVLLRVLFGQSDFTKRLQDQWVYSEQTAKGPQDRWARFVCVRSAALATHWLTYWDKIADGEADPHPSWEDWLTRWDEELNPDTTGRAHPLDPQDVFSQNRGFVLNRHSAGPRIKSTMVLLDLRLEPVRNALYSIKDFSSYNLRRTIKAEKPDLPVIMFTASRQILNFAELLDSSGDIDGWFIKEGPDIPVDSEDGNSANSVAYLLERLHLYATLRGWYRASFAWDAERKLAYARLVHAKEAETVFSEVTRLSDGLLQEILQGKHSAQGTETYLSFIQERVPPTPFPVSQTLVARRVAVAALLWTADMTPAGPEWNTDAFARLLPGRPIKKIVKWVYDKLNFNQVLWMRSSGILSQLLREEIDWLAKVDWPEDKRAAILESLDRERPLLDS
jgi:hypothetical protein